MSRPIFELRQYTIMSIRIVVFLPKFNIIGTGFRVLTCPNSAARCSWGGLAGVLLLPRSNVFLRGLGQIGRKRRAVRNGPPLDYGVELALARIGRLAYLTTQELGLL